MSINSKRVGFIVDAFYFIIISVILWLILKYAIGLVLPFIISFAIAAFVYRIATPLSQRIKRLSYPAAAAIATTVLFATFGVTLFLIGTALIRQFVEFAIWLPSIATSMTQSVIDTVDGWIKAIPGRIGDSIYDYFQKTISDMPGTLKTIAELFSGPLMNSVGAVGELALKLPSLIIAIAITIISTYFISMDFKGIKSMLLSILPSGLQPLALKTKHLFCNVLLKMLKTYSFLMLLTFTELAVGFSLISLAGEDISYPIPLSLIIALIDILPVLGVGTVLIPWAVIELISGNSHLAIMLIALYAFVAIIRNYLEPKLIGQRFGLHPALTLVAIYVGGKLFGFIGIFALPITLIIISQLRNDEKFRKGTT
ncbi:MAG: AI-2E family transporter [Clostridia bacterium]|nr:AI-2E family transporter [Clostridia bacterium]